MGLGDGHKDAERRLFHGGTRRDYPSWPVPGTRLVDYYSMAPFPTANVFKKGHWILVDISSSNFPRFDVNPGTGEALGRNTRMVTRDKTVHHSAGYPSHIVLPVAAVK